MRVFLLFILTLASKPLLACGYYPYGEDTRISLFNPSIFGYKAYSNFYYSSDLFADTDGNIPKEFTLPNTKLWFEYCHGKVDIPSIDLAVYRLSEADIDEHSKNELIQYLYRQNDNDALHYLRLAKSCEFFNSWQEDPWERNAEAARPKRAELMNRAISFAGSVRNQELKKRYTFLAIRLAWYNHSFDIVQSLFASVFEKTPNKDLLYYWSLYFKSFTESDKARANFELAQVLAHAPDKRFACHLNYHSKVTVNQALQFAQTNAEKANVWLLYGIERPDKTLPYLQKIYGLNPATDGLSFLLLREINKIEDFVLTPYYTLFQPSLTFNFGSENGDTSTRQTLSRSERDRLYAKEVLEFVSTVDLEKVENPFFWQCCKAYLQFLTRDNKACLALVHQLEKSTTDPAILNQLNLIKALATTASQTHGSAQIPVEIQSTIIANQENGQFVFAIGKELEYLGNTTDAALLFARMNKFQYGGSDHYWEINRTMYWKTIKNKGATGTDYFEDYFFYSDAVYSPEQVQDLIDDILKNKDNKDSFSVFKYAFVKEEIPRLYDLLGTKYIRQNKLENASAAFGKLDNRYWSRMYTHWGDQYNVFNKNPFFNLKYFPDFIPQNDTFRLNKFTITNRLISYLKRAEDPKEKDRDYYYFLLGNAFYNMGGKGNVSMMRRMTGWSGYYLSVIEDEAEFRTSAMAKQYYLLAKEQARTDKFKALCLRMVVLCEENNLRYLHIKNHDDLYDLDNSHSPGNHYLTELKIKYPDYFDDLVSSCDYFETYFKARR